MPNVQLRSLDAVGPYVPLACVQQQRTHRVAPQMALAHHALDLPAPQLGQRTLMRKHQQPAALAPKGNPAVRSVLGAMAAMRAWRAVTASACLVAGQARTLALTAPVRF